jgi:hypothetical protein
MTTFRGEPNTTYTYNDFLAGEVTLRTDDDGEVIAGNAERQRAAAGLGLEAVDDKPKKHSKPASGEGA